MLRSTALLAVAFSSVQPSNLNAAVPVTQDPVWSDTVYAVEELRFGELAGADEYTFGAIGAFAVDASGGILLYDAQVPVIRQFQANGQHVRDIGRRGEGPGEYLRVTGLGFLPNGDIAAWDLAQQRITVYDTAGDYMRSHRVCCGIAAPQSFRVDKSGSYYLKAALVSSEGGRPSGQWPRAYLRVTPDGELADTLRLPYEEAPDRPLVLPLPEGTRVPFVEERFHAVGPGGELYQGRNSSYAIERSIAGEVSRITRDIPPERLTGPERRQWEAWTEFVDRRERARGFRHEFHPIPDTKPFFRGLFVDADGRLWVDRYVEARRIDQSPFSSIENAPSYVWREPPTYDVFAPDGRLLGTVLLPTTVRLMDAAGPVVWGVARGSFDEEYVVRLILDGT